MGVSYCKKNIRTMLAGVCYVLWFYIFFIFYFIRAELGLK